MEPADWPAVKLAVRDLLREAFTAADDGDDEHLKRWAVYYTWPGDIQDDRRIILGNTDEGAGEQTAFGGGSVQFNDRFLLPLIFEVRGEIPHDDEEIGILGDRVCQAGVDLAERTLFTGSRLSPLNLTCTPARRAGPNPYWEGELGNDPLSAAVRELQITVPVTP